MEEVRISIHLSEIDLKFEVYDKQMTRNHDKLSLKSHKRMLCRVFSSVPKTYFVHREFSFTLKDDVYLRYQSFADHQELEKEILKRNPYKIDIGAVFTHKVPSSVFSAFSSLCNVTFVTST